jgi:adenine nucleotide transporter 17
MCRYFAVFYFSYAALRKLPLFYGHGRLAIARGLLHGITAGATTQLTTLPVDILLVRTCVSKQAQDGSHRAKKNSPWQHSVAIYRTSGLAGFWAGLLPALVLTVNPGISMLLIESLPFKSAFWRGMIAKAVASVLTYPYVQAKILLQTQREPSKGKEGLLYNGTWDCLRRRWIADGVSGWYTGSFPQLFNAVLKEALLNWVRELVIKVHHLNLQ